MPEAEFVERVIAAVRAKPKYAQVDEGFVRALSVQECGKDRSFKEAVKQVCGRLHQTGSAYFRNAPDYPALAREIEGLPPNARHTETLAFCRRVMALHASTAERLPILETFYKETLADIAPLHSVLDLACGFNPLAAGWMQLAANARYIGLDIFANMTALMQQFLLHTGFAAEISLGDISQVTEFPKTQLAFILKTLPCLEQAYTGISARLLQRIPAEHLLITYPIRSLGGRAKGMRQTYAAQFTKLSESQSWQVKRFDFESELAFLISR